MSIYLFKDFGLGLVYFEGGGFYVLGELGFQCFIFIYSIYRIYEFNNDFLY